MGLLLAMKSALQIKCIIIIINREHIVAAVIFLTTEQRSRSGFREGLMDQNICEALCVIIRRRGGGSRLQEHFHML